MRFEASTEQEIDWIRTKLNIAKIEDTKGISALSDSGELYGVCAMESWTEGSCQVHIVINNPICLKGYKLFREVFNYIFNVGNRHTALGFVSADNDKALNFDKKIGFKELARIKDGFKLGTDTVILELRRENCKWIDKEAPK